MVNLYKKQLDEALKIYTASIEKQQEDDKKFLTDLKKEIEKEMQETMLKTMLPPDNFN